MKEKSIELMNKAIADELSAVHQYMYFHFHCDDLGYDLLSNLFKRTVIEELMHVEKLCTWTPKNAPPTFSAGHGIPSLHRNSIAAKVPGL